MKHNGGTITAEVRYTHRKLLKIRNIKLKDDGTPVSKNLPKTGEIVYSGIHHNGERFLVSSLEEAKKVVRKDEN